MNYVPALDLLHIIEAAPHTAVAGKHVVGGGKAVVSSIGEHGIAQRVLHHWQVDHIR